MANRKPAQRIFQVEPRGKDKKDFWREVGTMWGPNKDGGFSHTYTVVPMFGKYDVVSLPYEQKAPNEE